MGDPIEEAKARVKEAAGAITGSSSLRREGRSQQSKADAQEKAARHEEQAESARIEASKAEAAERRNQ